MVRFSLPEGSVSAELMPAVPIMVQDSRLTTVAEVRTQSPTELDEGLYRASAQLPNGVSFATLFQVPASGIVELAIEEGFESFAADEPASDQPVSDDARGAGEPCRISVITGNPLAAEPRFETSELDCSGEIAIDGEHRSQMLRVEAPGRPPMILVLPAAPGKPCRVLPAPDGGDGLPHIMFADPDVELLLRYSGAGMMDKVLTLSRTSREESSLQPGIGPEGRDYAIGAVVEAYVLLRFSPGQAKGGAVDGRSTSVSGVGSWLEEIAANCDWLPDGPIALAETLARAGEHETALRWLLTIEERGLPFFSVGLTYALDRLLQYGELFDNARARRLGAGLSRIACQTEFERPLLTFREPAFGLEALLAPSEGAGRARAEPPAHAD